MSKYAVVHLRNYEVEAVFVESNEESARELAIDYAIRSNFYGCTINKDLMARIQRDVQRDNYLSTEYLENGDEPIETVVIKRVFQAGKPKLVF